MPKRLCPKVKRGKIIEGPDPGSSFLMTSIPNAIGASAPARLPKKKKKKRSPRHAKYDGRHYPNSLLLGRDPSGPDGDAGKDEASIREFILRCKSKVLRGTDLEDDVHFKPGIYTGACGTAFMCLRLAIRGEASTRGETRNTLLNTALEIVLACKDRFHRRRYATFVEGRAGAVALEIVIRFHIERDIWLWRQRRERERARAVDAATGNGRRQQDRERARRRAVSDSVSGGRRGGKEVGCGEASTSFVESAELHGAKHALLDICLLVEKMYDTECEILYGRCGYLQALLFVRSHLDDDSFGVHQAEKIVSQVLASGREAAAMREKEDGWKLFPLFYEWKSKCYYGAAHGIAGIVQTLLSFPRALAADDRTRKKDKVKHRWLKATATISQNASPSALSSVASLALETKAMEHAVLDAGRGGGGATGELLACVDALLSTAFEDSGNIPSSANNEKDKLVQWCHGAAGIIPALCTCVRVARRERRGKGSAFYLAEAEKLGEIVWTRGLLHKGLGLCHGVSGNGYAFLTLARTLAELGPVPSESGGGVGEGRGDVATGSRFQDASSRSKTRAARRQLWLRRARAFALFGSNETILRAVEEVPDQPLSLFNGLAGAVVFCCDVLHPRESAFPGFEREAAPNFRNQK